MLLSVKLNRRWPSPLAQTCWREKERTGTDAAYLMDVFIEPLLFLCAVSSQDTRRFKWAWQGHALAIEYAETSLELTVHTYAGMRPL